MIETVHPAGDGQKSQRRQRRCTDIIERTLDGIAADSRNRQNVTDGDKGTGKQASCNDLRPRQTKKKPESHVGESGENNSQHHERQAKARQSDIQFQSFIAPQYFIGDAFSQGSVTHDAVRFQHMLKRLSVNAEDDIPCFHAGTVGSTVANDGKNRDTRRDDPIKRLCQIFSGNMIRKPSIEFRSIHLQREHGILAIKTAERIQKTGFFSLLPGINKNIPDQNAVDR